MPWHAKLSLDYTLEAGRSVARYQHEGPLRILQSLYPEGDGVCHNVLVHPPGGLVGGDTLSIDVNAGGESHGLITTPGATRFYRSDGLPAIQTTTLTLQDQARLEWLPMEALCYDSCLAENRLQLHLGPDAECMGWDVTALGLPHAQLPFLQGRLRQRLEVPGIWLEQGTLDGGDTRLLNSPVGLAGNRCLGILFFVAGKKLTRGRREHALEVARSLLGAHTLQATAGATSPHERIVVVRVLAPVVEPAMQLLKAVWAAWRAELWHKSAASPRIWDM